MRHEYEAILKACIHEFGEGSILAKAPPGGRVATEDGVLRGATIAACRHFDTSHPGVKPIITKIWPEMSYTTGRFWFDRYLAESIHRQDELMQMIQDRLEGT